MSGDHKRKSRPIAPAEVRVGDGWIEVVVPDVLGKNEAHTAGRGGARHTSAATKRYRESVLKGFTRWMAQAPSLDGCQAVDSAWRLEVLGVWPRENHTAGFPCPKGDADAAIPQALDAMQHAGILDDDARVVEVRAWNLYRKDVRCTVIRLVRVDDLAERDAAVAHLVDRVPASPSACPHPSRNGKHEVYLDRDKTFCRACGAVFPDIAKLAPKQRRLRGLTKPRKETPCTTTTSSS